MALLADVTAGNPVSASWGNALRDQSIQTTTAATLPSVPAEGMVVYTTDDNRLLIYDGAAWQVLSSSTRIGCSVTATTFSVASGAATRTVTFGAETYDSDGFFTASSTDVTVPTGLGGLYAVNLNIQWDTDPGASTWVALRVQSGSQNYAWRSENTLFRSAFGTTDYFSGVATTVPLAAGDIVQGIVTQTSGGAINVNALMTVYRIGV